MYFSCWPLQAYGDNFYVYKRCVKWAGYCFSLICFLCIVSPSGEKQRSVPELLFLYYLRKIYCNVSTIWYDATIKIDFFLNLCQIFHVRMIDEKIRCHVNMLFPHLLMSKQCTMIFFDNSKHDLDCLKFLYIKVKVFQYFIIKIYRPFDRFF